MVRDRFAAFCWGVLAYNVAVVVWGAFVRATGSGAGCGSHWPLCNGEVVPLSAGLETLIEFSHRVTSGLALLTVVALAVWAFRRFRRGHPARLGAALSVAFMLSEAAVGAGLVLFRLVADDESLARALFVAVHLLNTFLLLASLTLTAHWVRGGRRIAPRLRDGRTWGLVAALGGLLLVGVSGAVSALGDTLFPASSLAEALGQDLSPTAHVFVRLRVLHPLIAVVAGLYLLFLSRVPAGGRPPGREQRLSASLSLLVLAQLGLGTLNVALLAPVWAQLVHLLLADLVWIVLVLVAAERLGAGAPAAAVARRPAAERGEADLGEVVR
jgi:heme A synthase